MILLVLTWDTGSGRNSQSKAEPALAEAYVQDASLDTTDYPEIVQDVLEVAEYGIIDVEQ